jgi:hypothetical protein
MVDAVIYNEQLAAKVTQVKVDFHDRLKTFALINIDNGNGRAQHASYELTKNGVVPVRSGLSLENTIDNTVSMTYDDLLTQSLQGKLTVVGSSKGSAYLKLLISYHQDEPQLNASEVQSLINEHFQIESPSIEEPSEPSYSFRR